MSTRYEVCYGPDTVHLIALEDGESFATGQPTTEEFATADPAALRAQELGYPFPVFSMEEEFYPGDYVTYEGFLFQALADIKAYTPDDLPPIDNPAWRRITPPTRNSSVLEVQEKTKAKPVAKKKTKK